MTNDLYNNHYDNIVHKTVDLYQNNSIILHNDNYYCNMVFIYDILILYLQKHKVNQFENITTNKYSHLRVHIWLVELLQLTINNILLIINHSKNFDIIKLQFLNYVGYIIKKFKENPDMVKNNNLKIILNKIDQIINMKKINNFKKNIINFYCEIYNLYHCIQENEIDLNFKEEISNQIKLSHHISLDTLQKNKKITELNIHKIQHSFELWNLK
ncbi:hypothetical protein AB837_00386 [bacterium AB1]|nr:hypothetical protein AB837_00386 [bacterium AB1]